MQRIQDRAGVLPALGLPGILLPEAATVRDQHQQRNLVEERNAHDAVDRLEEAMVLHQHRRLHAGEVRASRHADALFLLGQPDQRHLGILVGHSDQVHQPGFGQSADHPDTHTLDGVVDQLRVRHGNRHVKHPS